MEKEKRDHIFDHSHSLSLSLSFSRTRTHAHIHTRARAHTHTHAQDQEQRLTVSSVLKPGKQTFLTGPFLRQNERYRYGLLA